MSEMPRIPYDGPAPMEPGWNRDQQIPPVASMMARVDHLPPPPPGTQMMAVSQLVDGNPQPGPPPQLHAPQLPHLHHGMPPGHMHELPPILNRVEPAMPQTPLPNPIPMPPMMQIEDPSSDKKSKVKQLPVKRKAPPTPTGNAPTPGSAGSKRTYNRTYQTLLIATKVRHLKKKDGEPLWREDIQFDFLSAVFHDDHRVFQNSYDGTKGHTFADIYVDAMARSSKCSRVLREKLLGDRKAGLNMAMVCLLVNVGRMNTTLNFFPEMKAQLRTYHAIPSLQSHANQSDYKQLQDAPRLKSILKGACEDRVEPGSIDGLLAEDRHPPRTNPINLLFLMSTFAPKVEESFFTPDFEFFDLIMNRELSSASRARAFLWLVWTYLETDLKPEQLQQNPFGPGQDNGMRVPEFEILSSEQVALENVDPESEKQFGAEMTKLRTFYLEDKQSQQGSPVPIVAKKRASRENGTPSSRSLRQHSSVSQGDDDFDTSMDLGEEDGIDTKPAPTLKLTLKPIDKTKDEQDRADRVASELNHLIRAKQARRIVRRRRRGAVRATWDAIKDRDPLYNSDDDERSPQVNGNASSASNDYGEAESTVVRSLSRSLRWRRRWTESSHAPASASVMKVSNLLQA